VPGATNVMMIIGLVPIGLWVTFVALMGGVPMDLTWMGILGISGLFAYGAAVFVAGIAAVQAVRNAEAPSLSTWLLAGTTFAVVAGPWLYWVYSRSIQG
jgi:hypothetical protein